MTDNIDYALFDPDGELISVLPPSRPNPTLIAARSSEIGYSNDASNRTIGWRARDDPTMLGDKVGDILHELLATWGKRLLVPLPLLSRCQNDHQDCAFASTLRTT